jgi:hypothetical protein
MPKPTLCRAVIYRSKTGNYDLAAMVAGTRDSLYRPAVAEGHLADLDSDEHVHLVVFTPGNQGHRNSTTTPEQVAELTRLSTPAGGTYQEFNVPYDPTGETGGTWRWPERV